MDAALFHMIAAAPAPVAPYSHAVEVDGWLFLTGQIPAEAGADIGAQTRRVLDNLKIVPAEDRPG